MAAKPGRSATALFGTRGSCGTAAHCGAAFSLMSVAKPIVFWCDTQLGLTYLCRTSDYLTSFTVRPIGPSVLKSATQTSAAGQRGTRPWLGRKP